MIIRGASSAASATLQGSLVIAALGFLAAPIGVLVVFSFDANRFPTIPWGGFSLTWYEAIWADGMVTQAFANSLVVCLGTATIATMLGFAAAYVDYRYRFRGRRWFVLLVAIPPAVPPTILGMAMLAFLSRTGLSGTNLSIIMCHAAIAVSLSMALIRLRLGELGRDIEPAAWNLGASPVAAIRSVVIPHCRPAIAAAFLLSAALSLDEFIVAWFVGGVNETIPVRVLNQLFGQVNPKINAIGAIVVLVSIGLILLAQRFFKLSPGRRGLSA